MAAKKPAKRPSKKQAAPARTYNPEPAELEIVFTGLCSFLNLTNTNGTMPRPSVILPRTPADDHPHVPFIAFNDADVAVTPDVAFVGVPNTTDFRYRVLNGEYIALANDPVGWPVVLPSYELLCKKDCYWPEAKNHWDRRYVPTADTEPDSRVVAAYMRFGAGTISAERLTDFEWEFVTEDGRCTQRGYFAQEVVYRVYPFPKKELMIRLRRLDEKGDPETFTFTAKRPNSNKIKIWIGNSDQVYKSLLRLSSPPKRAIHFKHLNDVAGLGSIGPVPVPLVPSGLFGPDQLIGGSNTGGRFTEPGSGSDTGYCGPHNPGT